MTGCDGFFFKEGSSSGGSTANNYLYVANAGSNNVSGFQISTTGALTATTNSPYALSYQPQTAVVTRDNARVYVGTTAGIYGFTIGSGGALSSISSGLLTSYPVQALATSPDGRWVIMLSSDGASLWVYSINSDGTLTVSSQVPYSGLAGTPVPRAMCITPNGAYVYAAVGTGGTLVYGFNTSTGILTGQGPLAPASVSSDNAVAVDGNGANLYLVRSGTSPGLSVFTIRNDGSLLQTGSTYATGSQPYGVAIDNTNKYLYVANRGDSTVGGYGIGTPSALTILTGSPYSGGSAMTALAADKSGSWLIGVAYNSSPAVTVYGFDSTSAGRIFTAGSAAAGTNPTALALTH
jgi:6-phosphogluconolactonase (cycloisomerase 2 family)